jgi:hypothetical protein
MHGIDVMVVAQVWSSLWFDDKNGVWLSIA